MMLANDLQITVYFNSPVAEKMQKALTEELVRLSSWIAANGLKISMNAKKTQVMMMSRKGR